jgi:hypothetical protein
MEVAAPAVLQVNLNEMGAPNWVLGLVLSTIPGVLNMTICPASSFWSDRFRSRWGRRIPFLFLATIPLTLFLVLLGFSKQIGTLLHGAVNGGFSQTVPRTLPAPMPTTHRIVLLVSGRGSNAEAIVQACAAEAYRLGFTQGQGQDYVNKNIRWSRVEVPGKSAGVTLSGEYKEGDNVRLTFAWTDANKTPQSQTVEYTVTKDDVVKPVDATKPAQVKQAHEATRMKVAEQLVKALKSATSLASVVNEAKAHPTRPIVYVVSKLHDQPVTVTVSGVGLAVEQDPFDALSAEQQARVLDGAQHLAGLHETAFLQFCDVVFDRFGDA